MIQSHGRLWEHRIQILNEDRPPECWPMFYELGTAEKFVDELRRIGVSVVAIHSMPLVVVNSPGGCS